MRTDIDNLGNLYQQIHDCRFCVNDEQCGISYDGKRVKRIIVSHSIPSKIMLIGQALGSNTQRLSGLPYTLPNSTLSNTGRNLDNFLGLFGYTINSSVIGDIKKYPYSSDILQCYPGKNNTGKGDIKPRNREILNCLSENYLVREVNLSKPNLILLMGKSSRDTFFEFLLKSEYPVSLSDHIREITEKRQVPLFNGIAIIPIQHPSGANPNFRYMFSDERLFRLIKEVIY